MRLRWFPWKFLVRFLARSGGFIDPVALLSQMERFAQPSEVKQPVELLRAGVIFHARGLMNASVIQHNLDWVWPYWVERQYDPGDPSFVPRAFSFSHINLTHRNWTAVGTPGWKELPIVDPRGLVTPFWDGWSVDGGIVTEGGRSLFPSKLPSVEQYLDLAGGLEVCTRCVGEGMEIFSRVVVREGPAGPLCRMTVRAQSEEDALLAVSLRPYNPEGVSFITDVRPVEDGRAWLVNDESLVRFGDERPVFASSDYRGGDVLRRLGEKGGSGGVHCPVGMATAAALFPLRGGRARSVEVSLSGPEKRSRAAGRAPTTGWADILGRCAGARIPDPLFQTLFDAAVRTLVLLTPGDVYVGPFTYKRFWFRDSAFILNALLCLGQADRVEGIIDLFPSRQTPTGFFRSQEGEWDSNGEALWIMHRFCRLTGRAPKPSWRRAVQRGARWIGRKRLRGEKGLPHAGLLPPGFSAEHLGPNDYYYWDDFWGVAGLRAAADLLAEAGDRETALWAAREADDFLSAVEESLAGAARRLGGPAMPASPYRRMDAGAVGSLAAGYPLQILAALDPRLLGTVEHLLAHCSFGGGFFQDLVHSGINPYLTLHIAQVLMRAGDGRCLDLFRSVASMASPTGQWPEAVHPATGGGCMGDGQHGWAAAEWILMVRNAFLREEGGGLILGAGIFPEWVEGGGELFFGPAPTLFGPVTLSLLPEGGSVRVAWEGEWRGSPPAVEIRLPGFDPVVPGPGDGTALVGGRRR